MTNLPSNDKITRFDGTSLYFLTLTGFPFLLPLFIPLSWLDSHLFFTFLHSLIFPGEPCLQSLYLSFFLPGFPTLLPFLFPFSSGILFFTCPRLPEKTGLCLNSWLIKRIFLPSYVQSSRVRDRGELPQSSKYTSIYLSSIARNIWKQCSLIREHQWFPEIFFETFTIKTIFKNVITIHIVQ